MQCAESLRVQAYFDGELDALSAADIERHTEHCQQCRTLLSDLEHTRTVIRRELSYDRAPPELRARIARALDREATEISRPRELRVRSWRTAPFLLSALGGMGGTAAAAIVAFFLISPALTKPLLDDLVAAHVRSLLPSHLIDVVSTDRHTVKPWFAGRADVSPVVADFAQQGYQLIGGRADYLDNQRAAVVVYQHGAHVVNVFSWIDAHHGLPRETTRNGYHMVFWKAGNVEYCAVSDAGWDELSGLVRLLQDLSSRDAAR